MHTDATVLSHLAGKFTIQTENLASEALAFILQRSVAARVALATMAKRLGCSCQDRLIFETQLSNDDGSRPDIIGKSEDGEMKLLLEAKFWAGLTEAQPVKYLESFPASGGNLLLFVAPEKRLHTLWSELKNRVVDKGYSVEQSALQEPNLYCVRVGSNFLALTSWRLLIETLTRQVDQAGDLKCLADLKQLVGLCDQMDADAFLPLSSEEMTSTLGQRILQFCEILNVLTEKLISSGHGDVRGYRAAGWQGGSGRYLRLKGNDAVKGYAALIQFSALNWSKWGASPLWLGVKGEDWKPSAKVCDALVRSSIEFQEESGFCHIPIRLMTGVERERVIEDALAQIMRIIETLPPPVTLLQPEPPKSDLIQASGDEPVEEEPNPPADATSPGEI